MGQQESSAGGAVVCCTTRDNDESRDAGAPSRRKPFQYGKSRADEADAFDSFADGGTGGTGSARKADETAWGDAICDTSGFIDLACVQDRSADSAASRQALFGDKSLKPKLLRLRTYEAEAEALVQIRAQISKRLPDEEGQPVAVPALLEAGFGHFPEAELVRRLRLHEEAMAGVPEAFVTQACARVLGHSTPDGMPERPVEIALVKKKYAAILNAVDLLVQERIRLLHIELAELGNEVGEIEDLIALCFEKMDEEATGSISEGRFVAFVCDPSQQEFSEKGKIVITPQDAENLFIQMSRGQGELSFAEFKEEMTAGCLQVLQTNLDTRRLLRKRYRDYWF